MRVVRWDSRRCCSQTRLELAAIFIGLDISPDLLTCADQLVEKADFPDRLSFQREDVCQLPFDTNSLNWVWSVDCVGYPLESLPLIKELVRVVKPGGYIAILAWSSEKLLPGYPILEAWLNWLSPGLGSSALYVKISYAVIEQRMMAMIWAISARF